MSQVPPRSLRRAALPAALALCLAALPLRAQEVAPAPALAQAPAPSLDPAFSRARQLVSEGHGAAGRAIVDSVLAAALPGSLQAAEALWWRASLAASAGDAERDYRRLAVEFPISPRAEEALLRLAQLELTRGDREQAVRHLERLALEHPNGASRPRASYWMARIKFELNDAPGACAAIAAARATAPPEEVELRNQIEFTARRCARLEATRDADTAAVASATPAGATAAPAPTTVATPPVTAATNPPAPAAVTAPAAGARTFAVQVAAFDTRRAADALVAKLRAGGHAARVDGSVAPFRVRVGSYRTREDAVTAQQRLAERRIAGFVVAETGGR